LSKTNLGGIHSSRYLAPILSYQLTEPHPPLPFKKILRVLFVRTDFREKYCAQAARVQSLYLL